MNYECEMIIQKELGSNERLIWCGKLKQGIILRPSDGFMIPFSLFWGGFAVFWEIGVIKSGAPFSFWIFGIPFELLGLYLIFGRFIIDAQQRANTY